MLELSLICPTIININGLKCLIGSLGDFLFNQVELIVIVDTTNEAKIDSLKNLMYSMTNENLNLRIHFNEGNFGPGYSRNIGIKLANAPYVGFVDDDDTVSIDLLNKLKYLDFNQLQCDLICLNFIDSRGFMTNKEIYTDIATDTIQDIDTLLNVYLKKKYLPVQCQQYFFNKKLIDKHKLIFPSTFLAEDLSFIVIYLNYAHNFICYSEQYYYYNSTDHSLKTINTVERCEDYFTCFQFVLSISSALNLNSNFRKLWEYCLSRLISLYIIRSLYFDYDLKNLNYFLSEKKIPSINIMTELSCLLLDNIKKYEVTINNKKNKIFIYCCGPLGRTINKILSLNNFDVVFIDDFYSSMNGIKIFDEKPVITYDKMVYIFPLDQYIVIVANLQESIEYKIMDKIRFSENSHKVNIISARNLIYELRITKSPVNFFNGIC
jgi:glycosyltransferase involved in cell wall biosynthesis